jgi:hypothetical protein
MPVLYNQTPIVPAPFMTVTDNIIEAGDGTRIGKTYSIELQGTLVASPPGVGLAADAHLGALLAAQDTLTSLFSVDGKTFEVYSPDGSQITKCNPRIHSIDFQSDVWFNETKYTVTMEADSFYPSDPTDISFVSEANDSWQIEEAGANVSLTNGAQPVWKLTHTVSAKGKLFYLTTGELSEPAWQQARDWVLARLTVSTIDTRPFDQEGELNLQATNPFNHQRTENVDILDGNFSITETWILAYGSLATEDYTLSLRQTPEEGLSTTTATISGTIRGYSTALNDLSTKYTNALNFFNSTVKNDLYNRVQAATTWTTLNTFGISGSLEYNQTEGSISYTYEYNDRITASSQTVYDNWTTEIKISLDSYETIVTVSGTILGILQPGEPNASLLKFQRAQTYYNLLLAGNSIYGRAVATGIGGLKTVTNSATVSNNYFEGSINYTSEFSNRPFTTAINEYNFSVKFDKNDGRATAGIEGTIRGLKNTDADPYTVRYANALAFWGTFQPTIYGLVSTFLASVSLPDPIPLSTIPNSVSRGDNQLNGTIQYGQDYSTDLPVDIPNALTESLTISDTEPNQIIASIVILGRAKGPLPQAINTQSARIRTLTLNYQMIYGSSEPNTDSIVNGYIPVGTEFFTGRDEAQWNPRTFNGSRTVEWVYNL